MCEPAFAVDRVAAKLRDMQREGIWPNGVRYLWTDAFGMVLLVSLFRRTGDVSYLCYAEKLAEEVARELYAPVGLRNCTRDWSQYFHYNVVWLFSLERLGRVAPHYRSLARTLASDIHAAFVAPRKKIHWKLNARSRRPEGAVSFSLLDAFLGLTVFTLVDSVSLSREIEDYRYFVAAWYHDYCGQLDLSLGIMLWLCHFFPDEDWARVQLDLSKARLERLWREPPGCFARSLDQPTGKLAFANFGVALGLQSLSCWPERVARLMSYFAGRGPEDECREQAISRVMECVALLPGEFLNAGVPPCESRLLRGVRDS